MALPVIHTATGAAQYLNVSYRHVLSLIAAGELKAKRVGKGYAITDDALSAYLGREDKPKDQRTGRPERATGRRVSRSA